MQSAIANRLALPAAGSLLRNTVLCVSATALIAACAHMAVPLPFTPVPLTLQTFAVLLVGLTLGPTLGFATLVLYLAEGAVGLPVFQPHGLGGVAQLLGPTGGFLLSYPFAAAAAGYLYRALSSLKSKFSAGVIAGAVASILFFALGAAWLAAVAHLSPSQAWTAGIAPFLPGEVVKVCAAAGIASATQRWNRI